MDQGTDISNINFIGIAFALLNCILMLFLSRRYALLPIFIMTCFMTIGQQVVLAGMHFTLLRILILVAGIRVFLKGEIRHIQFNKIDKLFLWWLVVSVITYVLLWKTTEALNYKLGMVYNAAGLYFLFRAWIRDMDDVENALNLLAIVLVPLACFMIVESITGRNLFSVFGGVSEMSWVRGSRIRSQGPFRYAVLAGTFGATLVPLYLGLWLGKGRTSVKPLIGIIAGTAITVASASSGPVMTFFYCMLGLAFWPLRWKMKSIRILLAVSLIGLHMVMKAPVWYLIARAGDIIGSGDGWHRSYLIDQAIAHFSNWWLIGAKFTGDWMPYTLPGQPSSADITNQYIATGLDGGLITMVLFIFVIVRCFGAIGSALRTSVSGPRSVQIMIWAMGASLLGHIVTFISVTYFDQIIVGWYMLLAMISMTYSCFVLPQVTEKTVKTQYASVIG